MSAIRRSGTCYCDAACHEYRDCCLDKFDECPDEANACATPDDLDGDGFAGCDDPDCVDSACLNECGEVIEPDEASRFARNGEEIKAIQEQAAQSGDHGIRRGFHNKAHACVPGTFTVLDDLPSELSVGPVFVTPPARGAVATCSRLA